MSDTLSSVRRQIRSLASAQRRELKRKMDKYNTLSRHIVTDHDYDSDAARTTNDVINETLELAAKQTMFKPDKHAKQAKEDKLLAECNVVQPEVRSLWHLKIGMHNMLNDTTRNKLRETTNNYKTTESEEARNMRLSVLARWMVTQWCDVEGYDPAKHCKK